MRSPVLRAENKRNAARSGQGHRHMMVRHGLHDGGRERNVKLDSGLLALLEFHERRLQMDIRRRARFGRQARNQQILAERP